MTPEQIDKAITRYNKLASRRDERTNKPALDEIAAQLATVPAGTRNDVDLLLGRLCAVLPNRGALFAASMSQELAADVDEVRAGWAMNQAIATEQAAPVAQRRVDDFLEWVKDQTADFAAHMAQYGAEMHDTPKDWRDLRGDLDI